MEFGPKHGKGFEYVDEMYVEPNGIKREEISDLNPDGTKRNELHEMHWDESKIQEAEERKRRMEEEIARYREMKSTKREMCELSRTEPLETKEFDQPSNYNRPFHEAVQERRDQMNFFLRGREPTEEEMRERKEELRFWETLESFSTEKPKTFTWYAINHSDDEDESTKKKRKKR